jgi:hypothetical protein
MQKKLDAQYSAMAGQDCMLLEIENSEIRVGGSGQTSEYADRGMGARDRAVETSESVFGG